MTGPAIVNIFEPTPRINPSLLDSIAGDTTEFAKPVIGTRVPAPACFAAFSYIPVPVRIILVNIRTMEVQVPAVFSFIPADSKIFIIIWPAVHMRPPDKNATGILTRLFDFGEALSVIRLYCSGVMFIYDFFLSEK